MLDAETKRLIDGARQRTRVEISARYLTLGGAGRPGEAARQAEIWIDMRASIEAAVARYAAEGLQVLRREKTRPGVILAGPVRTWRVFFAAERGLTNDATLEFRHYMRPWTHGIPGTPE